MKRNIGIVILISLMLSCDNSSSVPANTDPRMIFRGTYNMSKLENGSNYTMKIDTLGLHCDCNSCDSMTIDNFADLFDLNFYYQCYSPSYHLVVPFFNPVIDKYGKRWQLTTGYSGPDAPTHYNAVYGDSIKISFRVNNILYYYEDSVAYLDTIFTHVGVKI